jgi:hypothetical protein
MPGVLNCYIKYEGAGDHYAGRCVSGCSRLGKGFVESIAYFDFSQFDANQKELVTKQVDDCIEFCMPLWCGE